MKNKPLIVLCTVGAAVCIIGLGVTLFADGPLTGKKPDPLPPTIDYTIVDGQIDAIMRGWVVTDVCYDTVNNTYLYKVFDHKPSEGHTDSGWYMMLSYKFVKFDNGTYALTSSTDSEQIFPDVSGLHCKTQPVNPDWGKNWVKKE